MNILVLSTDYPRPDGYVASYFVHNRNKFYKEYGISVDVISFKTKVDYTIDNINVYSLETYKKRLQNVKYDVLVSHAPNLRNHLRFIKSFGYKFDDIIFYFHGHEVLKAKKVYPAPYSYIKNKSMIMGKIRDIYDSFKLKVLKSFFTKIAHKSHFIFVSNWMYRKFIEFIRIDKKLIENRTHIIYNNVGEEFEKRKYDVEAEKKYDFITIRNMLDKSKYAIDIVHNLAKNNPNYKFCIIGKGEFYKYNKKPSNVILLDKHLTHSEIADFLDESRYALLPTRADAQGVMACEMATYGVPLITSNIEVCKEVFDGFHNVRFIDNKSNGKIDVNSIISEFGIYNDIKVNTKFYGKNTVYKEVELLKKLRDR